MRQRRTLAALVAAATTGLVLAQAAYTDDAGKGDDSDPPNFLTSPGQVGFTPDGRQLIVTTKASGSMIDVFQVEHGGRLSAAPVRNVSATPVPFAFTFTPDRRLAMGEAAASAVTTYAVDHDGTLADPKSQTDGQVALCWIQQVGDRSASSAGYRPESRVSPRRKRTPAGPAGAGPVALSRTSRGFRSGSAAPRSRRAAARARGSGTP